MIFVDSGFFVALIHPRDALHTRANKWVLHLADKTLTTEYVLWETVNFSSRPPNRLKVHELLKRARADSEIVPATPGMFERGLDLHSRRSDKDWSLTDCISFVVMEERCIKRALAHDQNFEQAGFEALLRRDPP